MIWTIEETLRHAIMLARHLNKCDHRYVALAVLIELGVPTKLDGFDYLLKAIVLFCENPAKILTKGIYPAVGQLYAPPVGALQVEQAIRSAIRAAWVGRDDEVWAYYFPVGKNGIIQRPSNAEFISRIGRFLELCQGCCEEVSYAKE